MSFCCIACVRWIPGCISLTDASIPQSDIGAERNQRILAIHVPPLNWFLGRISSRSHSSNICESQHPPPRTFCKLCNCPETAHCKGGGGCPGGWLTVCYRMCFQQHPKHQTAQYTVQCILAPSTSTQSFQHSIDIYFSRHTMNQVSLIAHNVAIYSLIHFPLQFCIPHCIANLLHHLEFISSQSSLPAASLVPWGTIPHGTKPPAACCLLARFPMDTGDSTGDHMRFCIAIALQHRPNLGRFDACHLSHPIVPIRSDSTC